MKITLPYVTEISVAFPKWLELQQRGMLLGAGVTEVYLMGMATGFLPFGKGRSLLWEFLVFCFWHIVPQASQWVLIDWECHLQSLNILPPSSPPGFSCYIVLHSSCPSIKHGQDWELSSQEMCVHYQPSYQHPNPVNHSDLRGPPASLVNKGLVSAKAFYSPFFFFFLSGAF